MNPLYSLAIGTSKIFLRMPGRRFETKTIEQVLPNRITSQKTLGVTGYMLDPSAPNFHLYRASNYARVIVFSAARCGCCVESFYVRTVGIYI